MNVQFYPVFIIKSSFQQKLSNVQYRMINSWRLLLVRCGQRHLTWQEEVPIVFGLVKLQVWYGRYRTANSCSQKDRVWANSQVKWKADFRLAPKVETLARTSVSLWQLDHRVVQKLFLKKNYHLYGRQRIAEIILFSSHWEKFHFYCTWR